MAMNGKGLFGGIRSLKIGFICPTYNARALDSYTRVALESFYDTTPDGIAIVVDDASSDWDRDYEDSLHRLAAGYDGQIHLIHYTKSGGLTRSWNAGLVKADQLGLDYAISGNNDVVFTELWYQGMLQALDDGFAMAGPLSNAPGTTAEGKQEIERYASNFRLTDERSYLDQLAEELRQQYPGQVIQSRVNGFFHMAAMDTWRKGKYSEPDLFYCPVNNFNWKGRRNRTPLMTLNEMELQIRWFEKGMKSAIALSSFIFHYRAVSRGERYRKENSFRQQ